jgi:hypothetical protein
MIFPRRVACSPRNAADRRSRLWQNRSQRYFDREWVTELLGNSRFQHDEDRARRGRGSEYGLDPRWSVKAEALYVDLGRRTGVYPWGWDHPQHRVNGRLETLGTMWIVRAGVNYKFGG